MHCVFAVHNYAGTEVSLSQMVDEWLCRDTLFYVVQPDLFSCSGELVFVISQKDRSSSLFELNRLLLKHFVYSHIISNVSSGPNTADELNIS